ncbi:MAG: hydrogenase, partial [Phycisphaerae bacterium]|nr:hydrogenase [Phycisphaerae bacterium]MDW8261538.1 hypothetical protein [Phycisphaerales bacterium]
MATITNIPVPQMPVINGDDIDNRYDDPRARTPLVLGGKSFSDVTRIVSRVALEEPPGWWYLAFAVSLGLLALLGICIGYLMLTGVGVWGNNQPVAWAFDIVNFVFWVGIGHAGTLISA